MTAILVDLEDLRVWTREPITEPEDVTFAEAVIEAVSLRISEELEHGDYLSDPANANTRSARAVALQVARRTYLNPDQEMRTASIGPIGGVAYADDFAAALTLTESELERLGKILDSAGGSSSGGLYVMGIDRADPLMYSLTPDIVLQDSAGSGIVYGADEDYNAFGPEVIA